MEVHRSVSINRMHSVAVNESSKTIAAWWLTVALRACAQENADDRGRTTSTRSSLLNLCRPPPWKLLATMFRWVRMTPFDFEVVPEVKKIKAVSSGPTSRGRPPT